MPDIPYDQVSQNIRIGGSQEDKYVDTQDNDNYESESLYRARLLVDSAMAKLNKACTAIWIKTAGAQNDTITITINGKSNVVLTLSASDAGNLLNTANSLASQFNGSSSHNPPWFATIKEQDDDYVIVYIEALREGENDAVRPTHGHFSVSTTGTTEAEALFDNIVKRVVNPTCVRDETNKCDTILLANKRLEPFKATWFQSYLNNGGSIEMNVDGSSTEVVFGYFPDTQYDLYITELRLHAQDGGSDLYDFMAISAGLTNGIRLDFKSKDVANVMMDIQTTMDMFTKFAYPMENSAIIKQSNSEHFVMASRKFTYPLIIKRQNTYTYDDYIVMRVRDNLTSLEKLRCTIFGYKERVIV